MTPWSEWTWDPASQTYYRARRNSPTGKWTYEFPSASNRTLISKSPPPTTITTREHGPTSMLESRKEALPIPAPTYLLQPHFMTGQDPVALCADLTPFEVGFELEFEPEFESRIGGQVERGEVRVEERVRGKGNWKGERGREAQRSGLVVEKGTREARRERRVRRAEAVKRVEDWRVRVDYW